MVITIKVAGSAAPTVLGDMERVAKRYPGAQTVRVQIVHGDDPVRPWHTVTLGQGCDGSHAALMELAEFGEVIVTTP